MLTCMDKLGNGGAKNVRGNDIRMVDEPESDQEALVYHSK
jgi:hypothetical protein